jgi:Kef-type K+ transport system membrane component KefB
VVLVAAAALGAVFEAIGQPTINGYLIAGAMVGPGGLGWVKELVQVESIAQLGVYLLLFALGMELNLSKLKSVGGVSIIGGSVQILLAMAIGGAVSAWMCDSPVTPGVFTGALLAMSSTSVVVKCLEVTR